MGRIVSGAVRLARALGRLVRASVRMVASPPTLAVMATDGPGLRGACPYRPSRLTMLGMVPRLWRRVFALLRGAP